MTHAKFRQIWPSSFGKIVTLQTHRQTYKWFFIVRMTENGMTGKTGKREVFRSALHLKKLIYVDFRLISILSNKLHHPKKLCAVDTNQVFSCTSRASNTARRLLDDFQSLRTFSSVDIPQLEQKCQKAKVHLIFSCLIKSTAKKSLVK